LNDQNGALSGVVVPLAQPIESLSQWQSLVEGLVGNLVATNPDENLDGLYALSYWTDNSDKTLRSLVITRLTTGSIGETIKDAVNSEAYALDAFPEGSLGLMAVVTDTDFKLRFVTLSLSGGYSPYSGSIRKDRMLAAVLNNDGEPAGITLSKDTKVTLRVLGKSMIQALDRSITRRIPNL
jgi:hypothetical protein